MILYSSTYGSTNLLESEKCDWSNRINMYQHGQSYSYITRPRLANYEIDPTNTFHWHLRVKTINVGPMLCAKVLRRHCVYKLVWKNFHEQYTDLKHFYLFILMNYGNFDSFLNYLYIITYMHLLSDNLILNLSSNSRYQRLPNFLTFISLYRKW